MSRKKTSWMRVLAFTVMMTLVLMTGATGLVVAEDMEIMRGPGGPGGGGGSGPGHGGGGGSGGPGEPEKKASIMLEKTASVSVVHFMDEDIEYYFKVTNDGEKDLKDVVLTDDDLNLEIAIGDLSKGSSYTTATAFNLNDAKWIEDSYTNSATVTGSAERKGKNENVIATATVTIEYMPMLKLEKAVTPKTVYFKDSIAEYTLTVTNQGCVEVNEVSLVDSDINQTIPVGSLAPGESYSTSVAFDLSKASWTGNTFKNRATAKGTADWKNQIRMVEADATASVTYQEPLTLVKTVDKENVNFRDERVTYKIEIRNNLGKEIENLVVKDETIGVHWEIRSIKKNKTESKTFSYSITAGDWDGDQFVNTARVEAPYMRGDTPVTLSAIDSATVTYVPPMTLEKSVNPDTVYSKESKVEYTFTIRNNMVSENKGRDKDKDSNSIKNVRLIDPLLGIDLTIGAIRTDNDSNKETGGKHGYKGSYTTTVAVDLSATSPAAWDGNQLINEATATGCYEIEVWKPKKDQYDMGTLKHGYPGPGPQPEPDTECVTLTATDTAILTYNPTTLKVMKDVPNVTGSAEVFNILISWEEELIDDEDPGDNENPQYRTLAIATTTTKSIQATISELEPFEMDAVPGILYTVTETTKAGYTTTEASFQINLEPGEDGVITFVNTKDVIEEETTGGGPGNQSGGGGGGGSDTIATVPDVQVPLAQEPVTAETLTDLPIPLADVPQTGSNGLLNLWWMLIALSGIGILIVVNRKPEKV